MRYMEALLLIALAVGMSPSCGRTQAQEVLPYAATCVPAPFDGSDVRRCDNEEVVCYLIGSQSISCFKK